jgi:hypothetical protein
MNIEATLRDTLHSRAAVVTERPGLLPAAEAASGRLRRRRMGAAASVAVAAAVALVLVTPVVLRGSAGRPVGHVPAAAPSVSPTATGEPDAVPTSEPPDPGATGDTGGANALEKAALDAVDWGPPTLGSRYNTFFVDPDEIAWQRTLFDTYMIVDRNGDQSRPEAHSYLVTVRCGDQGGSATVTLRSGDSRATTTARCAMTEHGVRAGVGEVILVADSEDEIELKVQVDEAAWGDGARPALAIEAVPQGVEIS